MTTQENSLLSINTENITRSDIRAIIHGLLEVAYSDKNLSYHEKTFIQKIIKCARLTSAEHERIKKDLKISAKQMAIKLSSVDSKKLYFLVICGVILADDSIEKEELEVCEEFAVLLELPPPDFTKLNYAKIQESAISYVTEGRNKF